MAARPLFYLSSARRAHRSARCYQTGAGLGVFSRESSTSVQGWGAQGLMAEWAVGTDRDLWEQFSVAEELNGGKADRT